MTEKLREKIDSAIKANLCMSKDKGGWDIVKGITCISYMRDDIIEAIKESGLVQLDENQELPICSECTHEQIGGYRRAQQGMLNSGFKRVKEIDE